MAVSMMKAIVAGNVGNVEPVEKTQSGSTKLRFSVAANTWNSRTEQKETTWWSCVVFGKHAETVAKFIAKGMPVTVIGDMRAEVVVKGEGEQRKVYLNLNMICDSVVGQGRRDANQAVEYGATSAPASSVADSGSPAGGIDDVDDIPF